MQAERATTATQDDRAAADLAIATAGLALTAAHAPTGAQAPETGCGGDSLAEGSAAEAGDHSIGAAMLDAGDAAAHATPLVEAAAVEVDLTSSAPAGPAMDAAADLDGTAVAAATTAGAATEPAAALDTSSGSPAEVAGGEALAALAAAPQQPSDTVDAVAGAQDTTVPEHGQEMSEPTAPLVSIEHDDAAGAAGEAGAGQQAGVGNAGGQQGSDERDSGKAHDAATEMVAGERAQEGGEEEIDEQELVDSWPVMLFWAASTGQDEDVRDLLLHRPDDLPTVGRAISKSLVPAADRGHQMVCELLLAAAAALGIAGRVVAAMDDQKRSVLTLAILGGHSGIVAALLQHCPEVQLAADGCMALTAAVARAQADIIPQLIAHCAEAQLLPAGGTPPLKVAIQLNRAGCIAPLLQRVPEAQLAAVNSAGLTALHYAAYMGQAECIAALLGACPSPGALLALQTEFGETAMMLAAARGHAAALEALVEYVSEEAQLGVEDAEGMTALSYAEAQRFEEGVQLLTAKRAALASCVA